ncbi:hypothetical protein [Erythrobacter aureus]|uniref:Uncharacterized protein n=1 Tax=Erythrobacter aureus TaxID=2182384 RepID=A0A345YJD7_9SPHN|nr:hypothetical protein [Erythrobacter aureus]AXK44039.1 hypothetical protein DVR09_16430 [Erythrobacter aureus]
MTAAPFEWLSETGYGPLVRDIYHEDRAYRTAQRARYRTGISSVLQFDEDASEHMLLASAVALAHYKLGEAAGPMDPNLANTASTIGSIIQSGKQIFRFSQPLTEEISHTDVDDVTLSEISIPYDAFYVEFPKESLLPELQAIEGLAIEKRMGGDGPILYITPFARRAGRPFPMDCSMLPLESPKGADETVGEAIARALAHYSENSDATMSIHHPDLASPEQYSHATIPMPSHMKKGFNTGIRIIQEMLPLVVNALLYIDNCAAGIRRRWDPTAPSHLVQKVEAGKAGARKAERQLAKLGWTKISLCDLEEENDDFQAGSLGEGSRAPVRAHWRRGHWRRQHYGPKNSLIKRIRIRPVRVQGRTGAQRPGYNLS